MKSKNRTIGITMGDPGGIGPEVIAKSLQSPSIIKLAHFVVIGDLKVYQKFNKKTPPNVSWIDHKTPFPTNWQPGQINAHNGAASLSYLQKAVGLIRNKQIDALVTAPVSKEAIHLNDSYFHGHTEFLAESFEIKNYEMMFVGPAFKLIVATRHVPLQKVSGLIKKDTLLETFLLSDRYLREKFKIKNPVIGVCGLNPHAGEGGTLGHEEIKEIIPAINEAQKKGITINGPFAADTLFRPESLKGWDLIIAMYHDQGLIPIKTLYFKQLVNLTIGLPFVRTSPAHGTAFDIVGKNKADARSMSEAIKLAVQLA